MERGLTNQQPFALEMARRAEQQKMQQSAKRSNFGQLSSTPPMFRPGLIGSVMESQPMIDRRNAMGVEMVMNLMPSAGITAFHGSPHMFNKFDMSKIGTGEGNQAFGRGLYLSENPAVAKGYTAPNRNHKNLNIRQEFVKDMMEKGREKDDVWQMLQNRYGEFIDRGELSFDFKSIWADKNLYTVDLPDQHIEKMLDWDKKFGQQKPSVQEVLRTLLPKGYLDEMSVKLDMPLAIEDMTGEELHRFISSYGGSSRTPSLSEEFVRTLPGDERAALLLKREGIPGVKYKDGFSRNVNPGFSYGERFGEKSASYTIGDEFVSSPALNSKADAKIWYDNEMDKRAKKNFVVFDDTLPQITHRNNQSLGLPQKAKK